ncbi:sugar phosphate nucleotidyltransferase [Bacillus spongiae]|uniref:Sugar phosphate nucleotidyltransferase n=1 Tax=Bacillus spongiae TaxID=2683610 RepID=A0ABU8HJL4_9BACI
MNKAMLGVIDATTFHDTLEDLLLHRSLAAVPLAGRYRLIDFVLSSMVNSGIESVAIFPKYQYRSLMDHLGSGKNWDLDRKRDGLFFFPAPALETIEDGPGSFNHFAHHMDYFNRSHQDFVVISNCYSISNLDFKAILDRHIAEECDITVVEQKGKSLEIFILSTKLLISLLESRGHTGYTCMQDVLMDSEYSINTYESTGYVKKVKSIIDYYEANMEILQTSTWKELFKTDNPIYTKVKDEPPTRYMKHSIVRNSMVANGCLIDGTIDRSVIFRSVKIGRGSSLKNCIVMQKSQIGENCVLESVILDKDVKIQDNVKLIGTPEEPIVIRKGIIQGELMNS